MSTTIIGVKYKSKDSEEYVGKAYTYFCILPVKVGDIVKAPTAKGESPAQVTEVDIPVTRVDEQIRSVMRTITEYANGNIGDKVSDKTEEKAGEKTGEEAIETAGDTESEKLIIVRQLPIIEERLKSISEEIKTRVKEALSMACTEDTVKEIKKIRSDLSKSFKELEEQRKAVKSKVLAPYEQFEAIYHACVTEIFGPADTELKKRIDEVENALKDAMSIEIKAYFNEYARFKSIDFISFERSGIQVTLSVSLKKLREQTKAFIDRIVEELALIETQEHKAEILVEYKNTLNAANAITSVKKRHEAIEAERKRAENARIAREQREAAARKTEAAAAEAKRYNTRPTVAPEADTYLAPPTAEYEIPLLEPGDESEGQQDVKESAQPAVAEKIYSASFKVQGTMAQLRALKEFLVIGGYHYESI